MISCEAANQIIRPLGVEAGRCSVDRAVGGEGGKP